MGRGKGGGGTGGYDPSTVACTTNHESVFMRNSFSHEINVCIHTREK